MMAHHILSRPLRVILLSALLLSLPGARAWPYAAPNPSLPTRLIPFDKFQRDFEITAGKDKGRVVPLTSRPNAGNKSMLTFGDYATAHLQRDPSGMLLLERLDLIKSHSYIVYDPILPILPANLDVASGFNRETNYRMFNSDTGQLKRAGRVSHYVQSIAKSQFDTPAGRVDGFLIEMDHRMKMEYMSELLISLGLGCREGEGPVFGTGRYRITKLGVFTETKNAEAGVIRR
jgi:hypothetical protein